MTLKREKRRRASGEAARSPFTRYVNDPVGFFAGPLGYTLWSKQREICEALVQHDRVAVKSCHEAGKSFVAGGIVAWWIASHDPGTAMVVTTAPTFPQVRAILWKEINRAHVRGKLPGYTNQTEWMIGKELVAFGRKPEDNSPAAFQGIHARHLLVVLDEACGVPTSLWNAAESLAANDGARILAIGNPDDPQTEFGRNCKPGSGYHVVRISAFDTPNLTGEPVPEALRSVLIGRRWVEERRRRWGETSPIYQSKVLGEFPEVSQDALISPRLVTEAINRTLEARGPVELGVDVARFGRNETVIYRRQGPVARLVKTLRQRDLMTVCGEVVAAVREYGATVVKVDDAGLGGGVTDRLNELRRDREDPTMRNVSVIGVNVGAAPTERDVNPAAQAPSAREAARKNPAPVLRFANLKAQLSWAMRERFEAGEIDLGDDLDTQAQICEIRYGVNSKGQLTIESKEDVEKRLSTLDGASGESGSPDRWDALVLAFADVRRTGTRFSAAAVAGLAQRAGAY